MCSNTESTGGGDGEFGGGGGGWSPTSITRQSHNNKRQRVPKRGPGVAELEKILREQERNNNDQLLQPRLLTKDHSQPSIPITTGGSAIGQLPLLPSTVPIYSSGTSTAYSNTKYLDKNALLEMCITDPNGGHGVGSGGGGGGGRGSAVVLPESTYFQVPWTTPINSNIEDGKSEGGNMSLPWNVFPNDQYSHLPYLSSHHHYHHHHLRQKKLSASTINNQLLGSASSSSIPSSSYGGLAQQIEPPSNQKLYQNYRPQEKVIGMKRRPPPLHMEENRVVAAGSVCQYQVPLAQSHRHIPEQGTLFNRGMGYNINFTVPMPRDITKWDVPIEFNHLNSCITETTSTTAAIVLPPFHTVQQQLSRIDEYMIPFQGGIKNTNQMTLSAESDKNMRYYSFLPTIDQMGRKERLDILNYTEKDSDKAVEDDIDLNLKLSTYS